jgi:hypothetical protein
MKSRRGNVIPLPGVEALRQRGREPLTPWTQVAIVALLVTPIVAAMIALAIGGAKGSDACILGGAYVWAVYAAWSKYR